MGGICMKIDEPDETPVNKIDATHEKIHQLSQEIANKICPH